MTDTVAPTSARVTTSPGAQRQQGARTAVAVRVRRWVSFGLLCVVALIFLSPLLLMVATSLKRPSEVFTIGLIGSEIRWQNYVDAFSYAPFGRYMLNSVVVAGVGTVINMTVAVLSGYAFSRITWRFRNAVFGLFLATMMIPIEVMVVPMFVLVQRLGWIDSYPGLIVPWAFSAFSAFMLRQFFMTIPSELEDAAMVDGAGVVRTFVTIMFPLARPTIAVLSVFSFIGFWNSFLWPLVIVNDVSRMATVPLGLSLFMGQNGSQWHMIMAASVIAMGPIILLLILLQRHLIKGIVTSGFGGR